MSDVEAGDQSEPSESKWWDSVDPKIVTIAKRMARRVSINPDHSCMLVSPAQVGTGEGIAFLVREEDLRPVWTCFVNVAADAIATVEAWMVEQELQTAAENEGLVSEAPTTDALWRRENGLDGQGEV